MKEYVDAAREIAIKVGEVLTENQEKPMQLEFKGKINLVTHMDKKSEDMIVTFLKNNFPDHDIVTEESAGVHHGSDYKWYVDPLDGTTNYAHRLPWYAVSIALYRQGVPQAGLVYNPANGETFYAYRGGGAFLNDRRIRVSKHDALKSSLLVTGFPYYVGEKPDRVVRNLREFLVHSRGVRRFGAASLDLCYVACGRYDGFWEEGLKPWDCAAGVLIVAEAEGVITNYAGKDYDLLSETITASNGIIHEDMIKILSKSVETG